MEVMVTDALEVLGAILLVIGVALFSLPLGLIVAGLLIVGAAYLLAKQGRDVALIAPEVEE